MAFNTHTSKQDVWEIFANYKVFREDYIYIYFYLQKLQNSTDSKWKGTCCKIVFFHTTKGLDRQCCSHRRFVYLCSKSTEVAKVHMAV